MVSKNNDSGHGKKIFKSLLNQNSYLLLSDSLKGSGTVETTLLEFHVCKDLEKFCTG